MIKSGVISSRIEGPYKRRKVDVGKPPSWKPPAKLQSSVPVDQVVHEGVDLDEESE